MHPLLAYALLYMQNWPSSEVVALPDAEVVSAAVTMFLNDPEWYCEKFPGRNVVTFFSHLGDGSVGSQVPMWSVDLETKSVSKLT